MNSNFSDQVKQLHTSLENESQKLLDIQLRDTKFMQDAIKSIKAMHKDTFDKLETSFAYNKE